MSTPLSLLFAVVLGVLALRWRPMLAVGFIVGWGLIQATIANQLLHRLPVDLDKTRVVVPVSLVDLPAVSFKPTSYAQRTAAKYLVETHADITIDQFVLRTGSRLRISDYQFLAIQVGEVWQLELVLRTPRSMVNPAGFDYAKWLFTQRIAATGYTVKSEQHRRMSVAPLNAHLGLLKWRAHVAAALTEQQPLHPLLMALIMADKRQLTDTDRQLLQTLGISHLFVISGLHIGLVAMFVWGLSQGLLRVTSSVWSSPRLLWLPAAASLVAAFGYAALAGFSIPTQRALVMVAVVVLSLALRRLSHTWTVLLLAAAGVLVVDPLASMSVSFWLSFMATACLLYCAQQRQKYWALVKTQLLITTALGLVATVYQLPTSVVGLVVNLVAIPLMSLVLLPLVLMALGVFALGWQTPLFAISAVVDASWRWLLNTDWQHLPMLQGEPWNLAVLAVLSLVVALAWRQWLYAVPVLPLMVASLWLAQTPSRIVVFDVGQGLAVLLQHQGKSVLYDTGAAYASGFSMAEGVLTPALRQFGISRLDALIVSHGDNDHAGGAGLILQRFRPHNVYASQGALRRPHQLCDAQPVISLGDMSLAFVTPKLLASVSKNDRSCVAVITVNGHRVLLPGDIERFAEFRLDKTLIQQVDVMLVPHHGSKTSSSDYLLDQAAPRIAIVSRGFNNKFSHPHPEVRARYYERDITWLDTATMGALEIDLSSEELTITRWRDRKLGFWH